MGGVGKREEMIILQNTRSGIEGVIYYCPGGTRAGRGQGPMATYTPSAITKMNGLMFDEAGAISLTFHLLVSVADR